MRKVPVLSWRLLRSWLWMVAAAAVVLPVWGARAEEPKPSAENRAPLPLPREPAADTPLVGTVVPADREDFEARVFHSKGGQVLPYRLLKPQNCDAKKAYPLVLFLHGSGERGDDNKAQLDYSVVRIFDTKDNREKHPCFVVVPQCPPRDGWDYEENAATTLLKSLGLREMSPIALTVLLLEKLRTEFNIDAQRQYVIGLSMGGYGTWEVISHNPEVFAAAVPICGITVRDEEFAPRIAKLPIWAFHGAKDNAVDVSNSRNMIDALKKAGGNPRYTKYPDCEHDCWDTAVKEPDLLPWLFAQKRGS